MGLLKNVPLAVIPTMKVLARPEAKAALQMLAEEKFRAKDGEINHYMDFASHKDAALAHRNIKALLEVLDAPEIITQHMPPSKLFIGADEADVSWNKLRTALWQLSLLGRVYAVAKETKQGKKDQFSIYWVPHYEDAKSNIEFVRNCFAEFVLNPLIKSEKNGLVKALFLGEKEIDLVLERLGPSFKQGQTRYA